MLRNLRHFMKYTRHRSTNAAVAQNVRLLLFQRHFLKRLSEKFKNIVDRPASSVLGSGCRQYGHSGPTTVPDFSGTTCLVKIVGFHTQMLGKISHADVAIHC